MLCEEDALLSEDRVEFFRKRVSRRNKYERVHVGRRRLKKLYEETKNIYGVGAYYDSRKGRLIKDSVNSASVRRSCNRRFRRRLNRGRFDVMDGGAYRRYEEYWWTVY